MQTFLILFLGFMDMGFCIWVDFLLEGNKKDAWCLKIHFKEITSKKHLQRYAAKLQLSDSDFAQLCIDTYILNDLKGCDE